MASLTDIARKPEDYVQDLMEEFADYQPEIAKTERSRRLRRNKDGSYIVTEVVIRVYLGSEKSMIVRTIEETTVIRGASDPREKQQVVKLLTSTKKYSREGEPEWSREEEEYFPQERTEQSDQLGEHRESDSYDEESRSYSETYKPPSYQASARSRSTSHSSSDSDNPQNYAAEETEDRNESPQNSAVEEREDRFSRRRVDPDDDFRQQMEEKYPRASAARYYSSSYSSGPYQGGSTTWQSAATQTNGRPLGGSMRPRRHLGCLSGFSRRPRSAQQD